jgi:hypothetical protein
MFNTPVRLVIADNHPVILQGLISLLGSERPFTIVASCSNGTECISIIRKATTGRRFARHVYWSRDPRYRES